MPRKSVTHLKPQRDRAGFNKNFSCRQRKVEQTAEDRDWKGRKKPGGWMVTWNSFHQRSDSEERRHVHYYDFPKCGSIGQKGNIVLMPFSYVELWNSWALHPLRTLVYLFVKAVCLNLPVSIIIILFGFLERKWLISAGGKTRWLQAVPGTCDSQA